MSSHPVTEYGAEVVWSRDGQDFASNRYSRRHLIRFDGGAEVPGSSSPHSVPLPMSDASAVDPEEAFVAAIASCHMLWFLAISGKRRFIVDRYTDSAVGVMSRNAQGRLAITRVTLRPHAVFSGEHLPTLDELNALHHTAHDECYIANSVKSDVVCEPVV